MSSTRLATFAHALLVITICGIGSGCRKPKSTLEQRTPPSTPPAVRCTADYKAPSKKLTCKEGRSLEGVLALEQVKTLTIVSPTNARLRELRGTCRIRRLTLLLGAPEILDLELLRARCIETLVIQSVRVRHLGSLRSFPRLRQLFLYDSPLESMKEIGDLRQVTLLSWSDSKAVDASPIAAMSGLRQLHLT